MTKTEIATIVAAVTAALNAKKSPVKPVKLAQSKSGVDAKTDRVLTRRASVARGFARKGIKVTVVNETGRFDNVKPYKVWLSEGRIVMKGQHGVKGLFHVSQTDVYVAPKLPENVTHVGQMV